jgi:hypothetical protein
MKPICVPCERFYRPAKNGLYFLEGMPREGNPPPGKQFDLLWANYKLWQGDKWKCPGCGHEIVVGVGREPIAEHYQPGFRHQVETYKPAFRVNDC